jgi:hypothetical protein
MSPQFALHDMESNHRAGPRADGTFKEAQSLRLQEPDHLQLELR